MKSVCAWCFPNVSQEEEAEQITHGICPKHMEQIRQETIAYWRKEAKEMKLRFEREKEAKNIIRY